jgi:DNA-binding response OmpR family regulator
MPSYNEAMTAGADMFMGSPFGVRELLKAVHALLPGLRPRDYRPAPRGG